MPEINANFTVQPFNIDITTETNPITVTPEVINLNISTSSASLPGGSTGELQYNAGGFLDGVPNTSFANGNLTLGDVSNIRITGGTNGYVLQTDGTGNLSWTAQTGNGGNGSPGGANTQIQYNDSGSFGGSAGFTFNTVSNLVNMPGNLVVADSILGVLANGNSNVRIPAANGNVVISAAGNSNIVTVTGSGANIGGTLNVTGNTTLANADLNGLSVSGGTSLANTGISNLSVIYAANIGTDLTANGNISANNANITNNVVANVANVNNLKVNSANITIGNNAGNGQQTTGTIAIGSSAGLNQAIYGVALGAGAGNGQGDSTIAIGVGAGDRQKDGAIAIGSDAGGHGLSGSGQGNRAVAIGYRAGLDDQGLYSIAIGAEAGQDGPLNPQANNSIILNATGANLSTTTANTFIVKPVRSNVTANGLYYNTTTGEISYGILSASVANTVVDNAQPNITSVGTLTGLTLAANADITMSGAGANLTGANLVSANFITGTLTTNAQPNITSVGTLSSLNVTGNVAASRLISNVANGTAPLVVTSTTVVANLNVATASSAASSNTANTVLIGAQPNITSVGTLSSLAVTGNVTAGNVYANSGTIGATTLTASGNVTAGNMYANSGTIGAAVLTGGLTTANQTSVTLLGSQTRFTVKGNIDSAAPGNVAALALGNVPIYDIISNALSSNFFIELGSVGTVGDSKTQVLIVKNNSPNTFALTKPASPQNIIQSAGTVNYYTNPAYPFTGSNIDMYEMTAIRIANVGGNPAYDLIIKKTTLS